MSRPRLVRLSFLLAGLLWKRIIGSLVSAARLWPHVGLPSLLARFISTRRRDRWVEERPDMPHLRVSYVSLPWRIANGLQPF
ncbi:hypothetical protein BKA70DRAFT_372331 [Coprinopsis sp. MPI-PUGE-AT-0042]|nr:hypothetical protein BKA70DRAFT_372331 [Coprinopsis sp. MPI-PUGE-AT-0042]